MNPRSFLKAMILLMLFPSLICLLLPDTIASIYTKIMLPLPLLIGFVLSLRIASMYKKWLQKSFFFLSLFLLFMMVANIDPLWDIVRSKVGDFIPLIVLPFQVITYSMLVISSVYTLKVMERRGLSKKDWVIMVAMLFIGIIIVMYQMIPLLRHIDLYAIFLLLIRFLDVAIVIMLTPVVLLYIRQMRLEKRESITFTTITCGIILSLTVAYGYEIAFDVPLYVIWHAIYHTGSILDALYLFSYLIIAVGLYVHTKYEEWGFRMIEKALAGG
uniref:Uncharacterized protein n=2 Tax=Candidatus Methanophagaceae archaeon ANME-1 ERB6 TaxID=2759912 RepID=A0A7G9YXB2_9EURY|nr:hypothetical protein CKMLAADM_00011 [Methanosarcinales archaeon ANME-1 ERB6]